MKTKVLTQAFGASKRPAETALCIEAGTSPVRMYQIATIVVTRRTDSSSTKILATPVLLTTKGQAKIPSICEQAAKKFAAAVAGGTADRLPKTRKVPQADRMRARKKAYKILKAIPANPSESCHAVTPGRREGTDNTITF